MGVHIAALRKSVSVFIRDVADELSEFEKLTGMYPLIVSDLVESLKQAFLGYPLLIRMSGYQTDTLLF